MVQAPQMMNDTKRPSVLWYLLGAVVLVALLFGGVWWAKNLSRQAANPPASTPSKSSSTNNGSVKAPATPQKESDQTKTNATMNTDAPSQGAVGSGMGSPSGTTSANLPSTGTSATDVILSSIFMAMAGYFVLRIRQQRRLLKP